MVNNSSILCYSSQPWSQVWILIIWNWPITFPSRLYNQAVPRRVLPICVMHPNTWPSLHRLARFYIYLFIKVSVLGILRHRCVTCWQNNFRSMPWSDSLYHPFLSLYYCGNVVLSYPFNTFTAIEWMMESSVWVDGQSPIMWPFKWNLFGNAFTRQCCFPAFYELIMLGQLSDWLVL